MIVFTGVEGVVDEDVLFGTCDLCQYYSSHAYDVWNFVNTKTGESFEYENGTWSWGDYIEDFSIENMVRFGAWFNDQKYDMSWQTLLETMGDIVYKYEQSLITYKGGQ